MNILKPIFQIWLSGIGTMDKSNNRRTHHCVIWAWRPVVIVEAAPEVPGQLLGQGLPHLPHLPALPHRGPRVFCLSSLLPAAPPDIFHIELQQLLSDILLQFSIQSSHFPSSCSCSCSPSFQFEISPPSAALPAPGVVPRERQRLAVPAHSHHLHLEEGEGRH